MISEAFGWILADDTVYTLQNSCYCFCQQSHHYEIHGNEFYGEPHKETVYFRSWAVPSFLLPSSSLPNILEKICVTIGLKGFYNGLPLVSCGKHSVFTGEGFSGMLTLTEICLPSGEVLWRSFSSPVKQFFYHLLSLYCIILYYHSCFQWPRGRWAHQCILSFFGISMMTHNYSTDSYWLCRLALSYHWSLLKMIIW